MKYQNKTNHIYNLIIPEVSLIHALANTLVTHYWAGLAAMLR